LSKFAICIFKKYDFGLIQKSELLTESVSQNLFILLLFRLFMDVKAAIKKRQSVRRYMDKKPDWRKVVRAIDAARYAPAAGNLFVMRFIMVQDPKKIAELAAASQQDFVGTVKNVVVAVSDDSKLVRSYGDRGKRYAPQQAGAAIENFLIALTDLGLATCWVGYFHEGQIKRALGIPDKMNVEAIFPIGIETKIKTREKRDIPLENILYFDKWSEKKMAPEEKVSVEAS
jgi:nitroreductase